MTDSGQVQRDHFIYRAQRDLDWTAVCERAVIRILIGKTKGKGKWSYTVILHFFSQIISDFYHTKHEVVTNRHDKTKEQQKNTAKYSLT